MSLLRASVRKSLCYRDIFSECAGALSLIIIIDIALQDKYEQNEI